MVDETRKGHRAPPLVLNPLQFSEMVRLAAVNDGQEADDRAKKNSTNLLQEVELASHSSTVMKVPEKLSRKISGRRKPDDDETPSATSNTYASVGSASFKTHKSLESSHRKPRDHGLRADLDHDDKASSVMDKYSQESQQISALDGPLNNAKISISSKSDTLDDYNFPGLENTPEMKQLMVLRTQLHAMKLQVGVRCAACNKISVSGNKSI